MIARIFVILNDFWELDWEEKKSFVANSCQKSRSYLWTMDMLRSVNSARGRYKEYFSKERRYMESCFQGIYFQGIFFQGKFFL
jgi:hypothetical protein